MDRARSRAPWSCLVGRGNKATHTRSETKVKTHAGRRRVSRYNLEVLLLELWVAFGLGKRTRSISAYESRTNTSEITIFYGHARAISELFRKNSERFGMRNEGKQIEQRIFSKLVHMYSVVHMKFPKCYFIILCSK